MSKILWPTKLLYNPVLWSKFIMPLEGVIWDAGYWPFWNWDAGYWGWNRDGAVGEIGIDGRLILKLGWGCWTNLKLGWMIDWFEIGILYAAKRKHLILIIIPMHWSSQNFLGLRPNNISTFLNLKTGQLIKTRFSQLQLHSSGKVIHKADPIDFPMHGKSISCTGNLSQDKWNRPLTPGILFR